MASLTGAANGWLMEYYPSATQEYGGIAIYMKFQNGTVTIGALLHLADSLTGRFAESVLVVFEARREDKRQNR